MRRLSQPLVNIKSSLALSSVLLLFSYSTAQGAETQNDLKELIKHGRDCLQNRQLTEAVKAFTTALATAPEDPDVRKGLIDSWQSVIEANPDAPENYIGLGLAYQSSDRFDEAKSQYLKALDHSPGKMNAQAETLLKGLKDVQKDSAAKRLVDAGIDLQARGEFKLAIDQYETALKLSKRFNQLLYTNIGTAYQALKEYERAIKYYKKALAVDPNYSYAQTALTSARTAVSATVVQELATKAAQCFQKKDYTKARDTYQKIVDLAPTAESHFNLGVAYHGLGQLDRAIEEYQRATELKPDDQTFSNGLHQAQAQKAYPVVTEAYNLQKDSKYAEAEAAYRKALQVDPRDGRIWFNLATTQMMAKQYDSAKQSFLRAYELAPDLIDSVYWAGECALQAGQTDEAQLLMRKYLELKPDGEYHNDALNIVNRRNDGDGRIAPSNLAGKAAPDPIASREIKHQDTDAADKPIKDKWALIIGISTFKDPQIPTLQFAAKDANDFADFLVKKGNFQRDHILTLIDKNATDFNIKKAIGDDWLPRRVLPNDLVVIFISTHGSPKEMDVAGENYLIAYNTQSDSLFSSGIKLRDLCGTIRERTGCDRIVLFLDACNSGAAEAGSKSLFRAGNFEIENLVGAGELIISSSAANQQSWESVRYKNGVFTHNLIDCLSGAGNNTSVQDMFESLREKVQAEVRFDRRADQTPIMKQRWIGTPVSILQKPSSPRQPER